MMGLRGNRHLRKMLPQTQPSACLRNEFCEHPRDSPIGVGSVIEESATRHQNR